MCATHQAQYEINTWTITELCDAYDGVTSRLTIPRFQRMLVWSEEKKKDLIVSVKSGFPIGALLMYRLPTDSTVTRYDLIDGLQRANTLSEFRRKPMLYLTIADFDRLKPPLTDIQNYLAIVGVQLEEKALHEECYGWISSRTSTLPSKGWSADTLAEYLLEQHGHRTNSRLPNDLRVSIASFLERLVDDAKIGDFKLPVIVYTGPFTNLSDIFDRLNSEGVKLNKFQIFAASWDTYSAGIRDVTMIDAVRNTYRRFAELAGVQIAVDPEKLGTDEFPLSLFEYFLGLNSQLRAKFQTLFGAFSATAQPKTESAAFNLVAAVLRVPFAEMKDGLPAKLSQPHFDLDTFTDKLYLACREISETLNPVLGLRGTSSRTRLYHAEYQIITYIALAYLERWDNSGKEKHGWQRQWQKLKDSIPMHYLYDIITDAWAGHGDSHMNDLLDHQRTELFGVPSRELWEIALDRWFKSQMAAKESKATRIDPTSLLFLKYLYTHIQTHYEATTLKYDGEHLIPKNRLKKMIQRDNVQDGLPISNVGNISFLTMRGNRSKRDRTLLESLEAQTTYRDSGPAAQQKARKDVAREAILTSLNDLYFDPSDEDRGLTEEWFRTFSEHRFKFLMERFFHYYAPPNSDS